MAQTGPNQVDALAAKLEELEGVCARLALENADLRQRVTTLMSGAATTDRPSTNASSTHAPTRAKDPRVRSAKGLGRQAGKRSGQL